MTYFYYNKYFSKLNKDLEVQISSWKGISLGFDFTYTRKCNHAGVHLEMNLLFISFYLDFTDVRHWDNTTNTWEVYN